MKSTLFFLILTIASFIQLTAQSKYDSLEFVVKGSISVLRSKSLNFYLEKDDSLIFLPPMAQKAVQHEGVRKILTTYPFREVLSNHLRPCSKIEPVIKDIRLNEKDLIKLFTKYFDCTNERPSMVEESSKRVAIKIGVNAGMQITKLKVEENTISFNPKASKKAVFGLAYEILSLKSKFAFEGQFTMTQYNFEDAEDVLSRSTNFSQFQTKLALKKYFGTQVRPFVKGCFVFNYNFGNTQTPTPDGFYTQQKFTFSFEGAVGIERSINEKLALSLGLGYGLINSPIDKFGYYLIPQPSTIHLIAYYRIR